jgi:hypothetical protein
MRLGLQVTFISGDVSEGSENDKRLISILGANWRELTRQDEPIYEEGGSRYDFIRCAVLYYLLLCLFMRTFFFLVPDFPVFEEQRGHRHVEAWKKACHEETVWLQRQGKDR